jgi:hypothetical protein
MQRNDQETSSVDQGFGVIEILARFNAQLELTLTNVAKVKLTLDDLFKQLMFKSAWREHHTNPTQLGVLC